MLVVLYECETRSRTVSESLRVKVFENKFTEWDIWVEERCEEGVGMTI